MSKRISSKAKLLAAAVPIVAVFTVILAAGPPASIAKIKSEFATSPMFDASSDYTESCARCHGTDGRSQTAKGRQTHAADLTKSKVTDAKGIKIITNGEDSMPAFKDVLTADQIREVMAYIRGFRR